VSEPVFEASVRLQADVSDFEKQAQASVKRVLDGIEQQTQQAIRGSQQRVAQAAQQLQQQAQRVAAPAPQQLKLFDIQPIQPEVLAPVVPPPAEVPPIVITPVVEQPVVPPVVVPPVVVPKPPPVVIPVDVELANIAAEISAATSQIDALKKSGEDASRELETVAGRIEEIGKIRQEVPEKAFQTLPEAGELAGLEQRAEELRKQITLERELADATRERLTAASRSARDFRPQQAQVPPQLAQAVERARTLATQPVDFTIQANTEQFEQQTAAAFAKARQLAQENADATAQIAEQAARESEDAFDAVATAPNRQAAIAEARLKAAVAAQADVAKEAGADFVKQIEGASFDAAVRPSQELQTLAELAATQAQTAGLLGDEAGRAAKELEAATFATLGAAEAQEFAAQGFITQAQAEAGAERDLLQAKADNALAAAEKLRAEAARLEREGITPPVAPGRGGESEGGLAAAFRHEIGGRTSGLAGLLSGGARFGLAGFAVSAAFEGIQELQKALRVTGDEAFTTQGRLRNMAAELTTGNFIGAIKALSDRKEATFVGGLDEAMKALKDSTDETIISLDEVVKLQAGGVSRAGPEISVIPEGEPGAGLRIQRQIEGATDALEKFLTLQIQSGAITKEEAENIAAVAVQQEEVFRKAGEAVARFNEEREAGLAAGRPERLIPSGTPGAAAQRTGIQPGVGFPTPELATQAGRAVLDAQNRIRETLAAREENDVRRARLELENARIIKAQADSAALSAQGTGQYAAALVAREIAETQVLQAQRAVKETAEAATREAREAGNSVRSSITSRISDDRERLRAELDNARLAQGQARATFEAAKAAKAAGGSAEDARNAYLALVAATTGVANAAASVAEEAERAREASQAAGNAIREAQISNIQDPEAQAAATLGEARLRENQARQAFERAKRLGKSQVEINQAYADWQIAQEQTIGVQNEITRTAEEIAKQTAASNRAGVEQKLENDIAAAALTKRTSDDKIAFDAAIRYWVQLRNNAENIEEREAARSKVQSLFQGRAAALRPEADTGLRQQQLQNQLAAAQLAGNIPQQRLAAEAIVKYWEGQVKALEGTQKAQAQASLIAAKGTVKGIDEAAIGVQEQRIQNRIQAARLTKGLGDDKRAADALVDFWERQVKQAEGADKVRKRANLIAARLSRQGLEEEQQSAGGGMSTVDFLKISQGIFRDFAGNLLPTGGPEAARALFPGFTPGLPKGITEIDTSDVAGRAIQIEEDSRDELRAIRRLLEKNGAGATVNVHQTTRAPDPSQFAQARWAHFAFQEAFNG